MRIGIIGCGFVADFYLKTLPNYPELAVAGVTDWNRESAERLGAFYGVPVYPGTADLLADPSVGLVVNLTNPHQHYEVSRAILEAGKSVYSEKPLAMDLGQAEQLVELAEQRGLQISSAPCNVLGEAAQTVWQALRREAIGKVYLAYAELDGGLTHRMNYRHWISPSGSPWPYQDEFEVGCTVEHAGYYVTWLAAFFGPARSVTSFASCLVPGQMSEPPLEVLTPDFSVGCIEFASGVVARLTNSIVAARNHAFQIFGDDGILTVDDGWFYGSPVRLTSRVRPRRSLAAALRSRLPGAWPPEETVTERIPLVRKADYAHRYRGGTSHQMDVARGVAELAQAIDERREPRISGRFALHVNEIVLTLQYPERMGSPRRLTTTFPAMQPMPWAMP
jgi:predicted dehydrogenase